MKKKIKKDIKQIINLLSGIYDVRCEIDQFNNSFKIINSPSHDIELKFYEEFIRYMKIIYSEMYTEEIN